MEKQQRKLYFLEFDVPASMLEIGSNRRPAQAGGGIGAVGVVGLGVGKGADDKKGVPHGRGNID